MELTSERAIDIEPGLKRMILIELIFPMVLLILGIYHGLMQVLYRSGIIRRREFLDLEYYQGLTLHGVINALVFTTFFEVAFGYAVIRLLPGRPLHAAVTWLAFALMLVGTLMAAATILTGARLGALHVLPAATRQPALLHRRGPPGGRIVDSVLPVDRGLSALAPRASTAKTPLAVVGMLATFTVWLIATLPLAYEVIVQLIPWSLGWTATVDVVLARTLFWFFGHPLVYFWLLPAYVMFYVMLPTLAGDCPPEAKPRRGRAREEQAGAAVDLDRRR